MFNLKIIIASTRPGRKGPSITQWVYDVAKTHPEFNTEIVDLAVVNLPFLDEAEHPRLQKYAHQHTKDWSAIIDAADAYIIVTSEYNYGYPGTLKNAIDFLYKEWCYKPVGIVSYGGLSAGTRAVQQLRLVLNAVQMVPLLESVSIPFFTKHIDAEGKFTGDDILNKSLETMLKELAIWTEAMKQMREKKKG